MLAWIVLLAIAAAALTVVAGLRQECRCGRKPE
jgi:hypothetical protein